MRNKKILNGKFDLHVHTNYSRDGISSVEEVLTRAKALGLNGLAITDHDVISGALKALRIADKFGLIVIPGIEMTHPRFRHKKLDTKKTICSGNGHKSKRFGGSCHSTPCI